MVMQRMVLLLLLVGVVGGLWGGVALAQEWEAVPPAFAGQDGLSPPLVLELSERRRDPGCTFFHELWNAPDRSVALTRWQLASQREAIEQSRRQSSPLLWIPQWTPAPEVGDLSSPNGEKVMVFIKGPNLVFVRVNSKTLGRDYTLRVARDVAARL